MNETKMCDTSKENQFEKFFGQQKDGVYVVELSSYTLLYANDQIERMFGKRKLGCDKCYRVMWGLDSPCADCLDNNTEDSCGKASLPLLTRCSGGRDYHIERIPLEWNGCQAIAVRCEDVTEQFALIKRRETELSEVEKLLSSIPGAAFRCKFNADWDVLYANDGFYDFLGYTREEFAALGNKMSAVIYEDDKAQMTPILQKQLEYGNRIHNENRLVCHDGSVRWIAINGTLIKDSHGEESFYCVFMDISEQKEALRRLLEIEKRYQIAIAGAGVNVWEYDIQNHRIMQTNETRRRYGYELTVENVPESLIESGHVLPEEAEAFREMFSRIDSGEEDVSESFWLKIEGQIKRCYDRVSYVIIKDENGRPVKAYGASKDITSEKLAERYYEDELQRSLSMHNDKLLVNVRANLTRNLVESYIADGKIGISHDGMLYEVGIEALAATGYTENEQNLIRRMLNTERVLAEFEQGIHEYSLDYRRKTHDDRVLWVNSTVKTYRDPRTGDVKSFMYTTDINSQRIMREALSRISQVDYDYIGCIDTKNDSYVLFDFADRHAALPSPNSRSYHTSVRDYTEEFVLPDDQEKVLEMMSLDRVLSELEHNDLWIVPVRVRGFENKTRLKQLKYFYLDREIGQLIITRTDVTDVVAEQSRQQELLKSALEQAEQASNAKTDFLSKMSHEIRTPMNAIIGMNALAAQNINDPDSVSDCISKVGISARYLLTLINDILDMSRIESGKMALRVEKIPFEEFLNGVNNLICEQASAKGITYDCIITGFVADTYKGDAMKLQQILINLLGNAVKFTPSGGKVQLIVSQQRQDNKTAYMKFTVNDTGCGISEDFQKIMFNPFEQEHSGSVSAYGGTGLGLAITQNLVKLMGGSISVSSIVGVGTEFVVNVPLKVDGDKYGSGQAGVIPFKKLKALIVDDEILICEQVQKTLLELGMKAEWVTSGHTAVERVKEKWDGGKYYDIILVDWKMPDMDGIETTRQIRRIVGPDVTIIIITSYEWAGIEKEAKAAGVNLLITKPLFKSSLISTFERVFSPKVKPEAPTAIDYDFTGHRVLLVEDHLLNVEVAKRLLEAKGMAVDVAENGLMAIEAYAKTPIGYYDVILMDIRMPVMDGLTATKSIRQLKKETAKTIPIIAMSANAFDEDMEKSRLAGMNAHLAKPIVPQLMYETIARFLRDGTVSH